MAVTEEDLNMIKRTVLTACRKDLMILDERDCDEIKSASSRIGSAEIFLDTLLRKGPSGYDGFCDALLYEKTQLFLLEQMNKTFEVLKSKVKEQKVKQQHRPHALPTHGHNFPAQQQSQILNQHRLPGNHHHHQNSHKPLKKMHSRHTPTSVEDMEPYFPMQHQHPSDISPDNFMGPILTVPQFPNHNEILHQIPHYPMIPSQISHHPVLPPSQIPHHPVSTWEEQIPYQPIIQQQQQQRNPPHLAYNVLASRDANSVPTQTYIQPTLTLHSKTDDGPCGEDGFNCIPANI